MDFTKNVISQTDEKSEPNNNVQLGNQNGRVILKKRDTIAEGNDDKNTVVEQVENTISVHEEATAPSTHQEDR